MKPWQLNRRATSLSKKITDPAETETRIDINCLSQPERELFERIDEIIEQYKPANPPADVIEKNGGFVVQGLGNLWEASHGVICCDYARFGLLQRA